MLLFDCPLCAPRHASACSYMRSRRMTHDIQARHGRMHVTFALGTCLSSHARMPGKTCAKPCSRKTFRKIIILEFRIHCFFTSEFSKCRSFSIRIFVTTSGAIVCENYFSFAIPILHSRTRISRLSVHSTSNIAGFFLRPSFCG